MGCPLQKHCHDNPHSHGGGNGFKPPPQVLIENYSPLYRFAQSGPLRKIRDASFVLHAGALVLSVQAVILASRLYSAHQQRCKKSSSMKNRVASHRKTEKATTTSPELEQCVKYWHALEEAMEQSSAVDTPSPEVPLSHLSSPSSTADGASSSPAYLFSSVSTVLVPTTTNGFFWISSSSSAGEKKSTPVPFIKMLVPPSTSLSAFSPYGALLAVWQDYIRYEINGYEVRQLLVAYARSPSKPSSFSEESRVAVMNLALVWLLHHVREIHHALYYYQDTMRCEENLDELDAHLKTIYQSCILSFQKDEKGEMEEKKKNNSTGVLCCSVEKCWIILTVYLGKLKWARRQQSLSYVGTLLHYMYSSSRSKFTSCFVMMALTGISARIAACASESRSMIGEALISLFTSDKKKCSSSSSSCSSKEGSEVAKYGAVLTLCAFELCRLAVHGVFTSYAHLYINRTASVRRDKVKTELYEAMTHLPLTFYDLHSHDDIEEMVYYVNDIEGVDVHLHQYLFDLVNRAASVRSAFLAIQSWRACALVVLASCASMGLRSVAKGTARWYYALVRVVERRWGASLDDQALEENSSAEDYAHDNDGDDEDLQEGENRDSSIRRDGIMLRGLEVVTSLSLLRPYGADVRLMRWWNNFQYHRYSGRKGQAAPEESAVPRGTVVAADTWGLPTLQLVPFFPTLGASLVQLSEYLIPVLVSTYGAARIRCGAPMGVVAGQLLEGSNVFSAFMDTLFDAARIYDVVLRNAYKTNVVETLLSSHSWEEHHRNRTIEYARYVVSSVQAKELQFCYVTAPTVAVFPPHTSLSFSLQDENGKGQLVCLVGPSGSGKSTLLKLLLGLYDLPTEVEPQPSLTLTFFPIDSSSAAITVNVRDIPREVLREKLFSAVPQIPSLFSGATIAHNVSLRSRVSLTHTAVLEKVRYCLEEARCDFVFRFPQGMLTPVTVVGGSGSSSGAGVIQLSGGQAQRLMLARALYLGGSILLMDEVTSGLDRETKSEVLKELKALLETGRVKGVICASHDEAVMEAADAVITLGPSSSSDEEEKINKE